VDTNFGGGIRLDQCSFTITNNIIHNNGANQPFWGGVYIAAPTTPQLFAYNTVVGNSTSGAVTISAGVRCGDSVEIVNSIIYGNHNSFVSTGCNLLSCWSELNSNGDPLLDASHKLTGTSPCIEQATPLSSVTWDIDGEPRDATIPDIGADEF
ncbi:MAG: hypothetical protein GY701_05940, partial [Sulfitobacter sp.]|nr:hypothetical protein [Sulfitobacter sp.]